MRGGTGGGGIGEEKDLFESGRGKGKGKGKGKEKSKGNSKGGRAGKDMGGRATSSAASQPSGTANNAKKRRTRWRPKRKIVYSTMDVTALDFPENSLDLITDKGTLDALLATKGDHDQERARLLVSEAYRTLTPGMYVCIYICVCV